MTLTSTSAEQMITTIIEGIEDLKGENINVLDIRGIENTVCDYYVICDGTSNIQVSAIVRAIEKKVSKQHKQKPWHIEGLTNATWVLIDYIDVVVHVFQKQTRTYYDIESLWGDAKTSYIQENSQSV